MKARAFFVHPQSWIFGIPSIDALFFLMITRPLLTSGSSAPLFWWAAFFVRIYVRGLIFALEPLVLVFVEFPNGMSCSP